MPHVDDDKISKYLRIFIEVVTSLFLYHRIFCSKQKSFADTYNNWIEVYRKLKEGTCKEGTCGCIVTLDYSFVKLEYQNEILKSIIELSRIITVSNDLLVMLSRPNYKSLEVMMNVTDMHSRIFQYNWATVLAAIKPQLFLFNVQLDYSQ